MAEERDACADGLTPECFEKHPRYAKKVFAYRLLQAISPKPLTTGLLGLFWKHLVQVPISWMEWEDFIIPDDIPLEEIIPDDWTPEDPLPEELTINLNEIIPDDWEEGDELPDGVEIDPGTEIPDDWKVGDEIPEGIHIDIEELFPDDWTIDDPLPEGIVVDIIEILPEVWTVGEDLPFGIKVNPNFRIPTDMLKTLGIYIEPGKTYEEVFPNGWDPTTELPDGASWEPYKKDEVIIESAVPPLYLPIFEPGPVHRVVPSPLAPVADQWENWSGPDVDTNHPWYCLTGFCVCGSPSISSEHLVFSCDNPDPTASKGNMFMWDHAIDLNPPPAGALLMQVQITANVSSDADWGGIWVTIRDRHIYVSKYFHFAVGASYYMGADDIDIGDNGGAPIEINLSDYGIENVDQVRVCCNIDYGNNHGHADYSMNYLNFA